MNEYAHSLTLRAGTTRKDALDHSDTPIVALFPAHPSQLWLLHALVEELDEAIQPLWYLRDKDVMRALAESLNITPMYCSRSATGMAGTALELLRTIPVVRRESRHRRIKLWISKYGAANIGAFAAGVSSLSFNDDDYDVVPLVAWTSYPFARAILATSVTRMGPFSHKALRYRGFHELFYLHPSRFTPDPTVSSELSIDTTQPLALLRLSALRAHHDRGAIGISPQLLRDIVGRLVSTHRIVISSETDIPGEFDQFRLSIPPHRMHHVLARADVVIGDSQTVSAEAAVLGTPSVRINTFVGRISYLEELAKYGLTFGFKPTDETGIFQCIDDILDIPVVARNAIFQERRRRLLSEAIDPVPWVAQQVLSCL